MSRGKSDRIVGFDRKISLDWLEATAAWTAEGCSPSQLRSKLYDLLDGEVRGMKAKANTISVLMHVWAQVPADRTSLRDDGLGLLENGKKRERLALHWGMCLATYPFFRSVATATGRLVAVQGTASLSQITRRVTQEWGERSTVTRAVQRVVRSLVLWKALTEEQDRGVFAPGRSVRLPEAEPLALWLLEAALTEVGSPRSFHALCNDPGLFPFSFGVTAHQLAGQPRMQVHLQGLDEQMVVRVAG